MNYLNDLTVFVITSGNNPNYDLCVDALNNQSVSFKIDIIRNYRPMSVAFQEMLNRCETKYYVEVDEDMILQKNAIEEMYRKIKTFDDKVAFVGFQLHDVHFDFTIYGVKIYRYDILENYPYNVDSVSCEVEQMDRFKQDGYEYKLIEKIVGDHARLWTEELIFERYFNLMEKFKEYGYIWIEKIPSKLWEMVKKYPNDLNLYALLGAYTSIIKDEKQLDGEKDFVNIKHKDFARMESFINFPITSTLYMTDKCNFSCIYCRRQLREMPHPKDMTVEVVRDILIKFPTIKSFCVCGFGEPLLCDNFVEIIKYLKDRKIFVGLVTNGSLIEEKFNELDGIYPDYVSVSLNGFDLDSHREITQTEYFTKTIEGINYLRERNITTYLSYICTTDNFYKIPSFLKVAKDLKVDGVNLHNLLPHFSNEDEERFWNLALTYKDQHLIDDLKKDENANVVLRYPVLIEKGEERRDCRFPWKMIAFDGDGNITLCNSVCPPKKENGNLYDFVIWHNDYCKDLRNSLLGEQKSYCKMCFRNWKWE